MLDISRRQDGTIVVSLDLHEALILRELPSRLRDLLGRKDATDRVTRRLFPAAYSDPDKDREYRRLLGDDLRQRKLAGVDTFERTMTQIRLRGRRVEVLVRPEDFDLWVGFVNDMRILIATELEIEDDDWGEQEPDPDDPHGDDFILLQYLSWLEDELISASGFRMPPLSPDDVQPGPSDGPVPSD